jgi:hypothetical protein
LIDRHWRGAQTLASHNPASLRTAYLGDFYLERRCSERGVEQTFRRSEKTGSGTKRPPERHPPAKCRKSSM